MTDKAVRDIQHEKGDPFTVKFIRDFDREWTQVTQIIRESGADLSIPIVKR